MGRRGQGKRQERRTREERGNGGEWEGRVRGSEGKRQKGGAVDRKRGKERQGRGRKGRKEKRERRIKERREGRMGRRKEE